MFIGQVIGTTVCTQKYETLVSKKLLIVQVIENGKATRKIIALDGIGTAGEGDIVYICGGREAALPFGKMSETPTDATIVGFVDMVNIAEKFKRD